MALRGRSPRPPIPISVIIVVAIAAFIGYSLWDRGSVDRYDVIFFAVLIPSIILHEISHGWLANIYGDDTAKLQGRLTLNPLRHIDPFGTFILPAMLMLTAGVAFGYAKPVPVDTSRMTRNQTMFTGLVGPFTNLLIAAASLLAIHAFFPDELPVSLGKEVAYFLGVANVVLAAFNLIPIPPLDGASVVERFLPSKYMSQYLQFRKYSMIVLLVIFLFAQSALSFIFDPAIDIFNRLLPWDLNT